MALALPLGQSAISLAIDKLWGGSEKERRPSHTTRRETFSRSSVGFNKKANEASRDNFRRMEGYQTWVSAKDSSAVKNNSKPPSFGGWDELDRQSETNRSNNSRTNKRSTVSAKIKMRKLSKKGQYRDSPLILRLIVAVFPFLGSWFKIL
ncbi:hypothetical protein AXF42_Ash019566 [Apostasia shenzhenica]|uniref:Uncharacterized protein n=1 Tax=Apostasia shenzhenica TaxID=1088818 RepID=A0A2I0AV37_9ASPA|nr:hypothetical protein AXF42_Ash019566 [Apostasia shenzhenica]